MHYKKELGDGKMDRDNLIKAYHSMVLIREYENFVEETTAAGTGPLMGLMHSHSGAEAWVSAVMMNLTYDDYVSSTYRNHAHSIARGIDLNTFTAEISGKKTGVCNGMAGNMHAVDQDLNMIAGFGIIGAGLPSANGAALAIKMKKQDLVSAVFFGDGAMAQGAFHESCNIASIKKLPVLLCNDNNHYAMSTHYSNNLCHESTTEYMKAYGIPAVTVDGMDFFASYEAVKVAIEYIRAGKGPYFIEFDNCRYGGQWVGDPVNYKTKEQKEAEYARCGIKHFEQAVLKENLLTQKDMDDVRQAVKKEIDDAIKFAEESELPELDAMYENIYADTY